MEAIEFNLLREPWIRVMTKDCAVEEKSLTDVLVQAHTFQTLAGELPTQDYAILRLLLAILCTVFERKDENGNEAFLESEEEALLRWKALWERGSFPKQAITEYLNAYEDRFWLFHPEQPFYQVPKINGGTVFSSAKLIGELSRSGNPNKLRLMLNRQIAQASYAEAARWLLGVNGFDDNAAKVGDVAWLGQLGNIYAEGENLFQTLMLNLIFLKNGRELWEEENNPIWEQLSLKETCEKKMQKVRHNPQNMAELLTMQSRRLILHREGEMVVGYMEAGGDYFEDKSIVDEQMTIWKIDKKERTLRYVPALHSPERQAWRDFEKIFPDTKDVKRPGVVRWVQKLEQCTFIAKDIVHFRTVGMKYDKSMKASVVDIISDHIDFHTSLLGELEGSWTRMIERQIQIIDEAAKGVGYLAGNLVKAAGGNGEGAVQNAKTEYYGCMDVPFREWLLSLNPEVGEDARDKAEKEWRMTGYRIAMKLGETLALQAGDAAFVGREVTEREKGKELKRYYCTPDAVKKFRMYINRVFEIEKVKEGDANETR